VRKILGASWTIAEQVNSLRNLVGTGHGRTLPTALSVDAALLVVREACSLAQFVLDTLDRQLDDDAGRVRLGHGSTEDCCRPVG
jgi:hypothetical protein